MSTVLIIGASRGIGVETVKLALKAGHSVRAMARSASAIRLRDPKLEKLACDNPAATHIVGKSMGATSQKCGDSYDEYVETVEYDNSGTQRTTAKLCLVPNLAEGICIRGDAAADTAASDEKVDCKTPSAIKVAKAVKGKADKTLCPPKTDASVYPEPPTTLCFGNP